MNNTKYLSLFYKSLPSNPLSKIKNYGSLYAVRAFSSAYAKFAHPVQQRPIVQDAHTGNPLEIDNYWSNHTVEAREMKSAWESDQYYDWVVNQHPGIVELMDFEKDRSDQTVLDYGCGPGNDLYRLLVKNKAHHVFAMDVSPKALFFASSRIALHKINPERVNLYRLTNSTPTLPLDDASIDHINCAGVLMHVNDVTQVLKEFRRVLKPDGDMLVMVYSKDSIYYHLYVPYFLQILKGKFSELSLEQAFNRSTDGADCPKADAYTIDEFKNIVRSAGLEIEHRGSYVDLNELWITKNFLKTALEDSRVDEEHKKFLRQVSWEDGIPKFHGQGAGVGSVFRITKA